MEKYFRLYWLQIVVLTLVSGFISILLFHFYKQHITLPELMFAEGLGAVSICVSILLQRKVQTQRGIQMGFILMAFALIYLLVLPFSKNVFFLYTILYHLGVITFYIPYNILYFENTQADKKLQHMNWYWGIGIIVAVIAPLLGSLLYSNASLQIFLMCAIAIIAIGLFLTRYIPNQTIPYTLNQLTTIISPLRVMTAIDGSLHKVTSIVALFALLHVTTAFDFGTFLSLISLVVFTFSNALAKYSDQTKKRKEFIWPFSILAGLLCMAFIFVNSFAIFFALIALLRMVLIFVEPLRSNIQQDQLEPNPVNWISREFFLNIGRASLFLVASVLFFTGWTSQAFIMLGLLHIAYPVIMTLKRIYHT